MLDNFLFENVKKNGIDTLEDTSFIDVVKDVSTNSITGVKVKLADGSTKELTCKILIGADGYNSTVATALGKKSREDKHSIIALRQYYKNINMPQDSIEIHFLKEVQPGYFWIFPTADGGANVGIGMLHSDTKTKEIDLKEALKDAVESDGFKEYFKDAEAEETPKAWNLSLGSIKRDISGNGYVLIGDAAGIIDPFSGEGIGNSMYSADIAIDVLEEAFSKEDFSHNRLISYDKNLYKRLWTEMRMSYFLQKLLILRPVVDLIIRKASKKKSTEQFISDMIAGKRSKLNLINPIFYLKIIF